MRLLPIFVRDHDAEVKTYCNCDTSHAVYSRDMRSSARIRQQSFFPAAMHNK